MGTASQSEAICFWKRTWKACTHQNQILRLSRKGEHILPRKGPVPPPEQFRSNTRIDQKHAVVRHFVLPSTWSVRLPWVWHRYPSVGLPIMHVLVVTQLYSWCVEIRDSSFIPFLHKWTTEPRPETPVFPSKIRLPSKIPIRSHYLYPGNYRLYQSYSRQYHHTSPSPLRYVAFFFYIASRLQPSALFLRLALNWNTAYSSEASF